MIAEIETDKATMEVEAVDEGVLGKILVGDGTEGVKVNAADRGAGRAPGEAVPAGGAGGEAPRRRPQRQPQGARNAPAPGRAAAAGSQAARQRRPQPASQSGNGHAASGERIFASPLARRMAQQAGIDLCGVEGQRSERADRQADIEAAQQGGAARRRPPAPLPAPAAAPAAAAPLRRRPRRSITAPHRLVPHSTMRKVIARRLTEAKQTIPHFYVSMDIEIDALLDAARGS